MAKWEFMLVNITSGTVWITPGNKIGTDKFLNMLPGLKVSQGKASIGLEGRGLDLELIFVSVLDRLGQEGWEIAGFSDSWQRQGALMKKQSS